MCAQRSVGHGKHREFEPVRLGSRNHLLEKVVDVYADRLAFCPGGNPACLGVAFVRPQRDGTRTARVSFQHELISMREAPDDCAVGHPLDEVRVGAVGRKRAYGGELLVCDFPGDLVPKRR
jgi:hypothetical protein